MAIVVERVDANYKDVPPTSSWSSRIEQSRLYGYPLSEALPTYVPDYSVTETVARALDGKRHRSWRDGNVLYNFPGLLETIYEFFSINKDSQNGVRGIHDIATTTLELFPQRWTSDLEHRGNILRDDKVKGTYLLNSGSMHRVTEQLARHVRASEGVGLTTTHVKGLLSVFPKLEPNVGHVCIAQIFLKACNLQGMGNDMDEAVAMSLSR